MPSSDDASALRQIWNDDSLRNYNGKWIAFRNKEIIDQSTNISELLSKYPADLPKQSKPIFALVRIGIMQ